MEKYNLLPDESIITKIEDVVHEKKRGELVLTNHNLVFIVTKGVFKTTYITQRYPVNQIKVYDGKAQVICDKEANIEVFFYDGQKVFKVNPIEGSFSGKKERNAAQLFADYINNLLTGAPIEHITAKNKTNNKAIPGTAFVAETLKGTIDTFKDAFNKQPIKQEVRIALSCMSCGAQITGIQGQVVRCQYCNSDQQLL
jgi:hypothetical protein